MSYDSISLEPSQLVDLLQAHTARAVEALSDQVESLKSDLAAVEDSLAASRAESASLRARLHEFSESALTDDRRDALVSLLGLARAVDNTKRIAMIRGVRSVTGCSLKEAKEVVDTTHPYIPVL